MCRIHKIILWLLSRSIIFSITDDMNFDSFDYCKNNFSKPKRFSIVRLSLGVKLYMLSWKRDKGRISFKLFEILNPTDTSFNEDERGIKELEMANLKRIEHYSQAEIQVEIDFLKYKLAQEDKRISLSNNKSSWYLTILTVILTPAFISITVTNTLLESILKVLSIVISYQYINALLLVLSNFKVRGYSRKTFKGIKNSDDEMSKLINLQNVYYCDWQHIQREATSSVSLVLNIQNYLKHIVVLVIIYSLIYFVGNFIAGGI